MYYTIKTAVKNISHRFKTLRFQDNHEAVRNRAFLTDFKKGGGFQLVCSFLIFFMFVIFHPLIIFH